VSEHELHRYISTTDRVAHAPTHHLGLDVLVRIPAGDWSEFRLWHQRVTAWQGRRMVADLDELFEQAVAS
jgi:hypothetical protein